MNEPSQTLLEGELVLHGRILPASNATFLAVAELDGSELRCVYKPVAGEKPLWDFPNGTLANRERAAFLVSEALGWEVVPETVLRDGPHGPGMVQVWCEPDPELDAVDLCPAGEVPAGFRHVLDAADGEGRDVSLVHEDSLALRRMAIFDIVVNNADRKGGHVLAMTDGHRYGVDHGVSFHIEDKLRTVLWGWAAEPLLAEECEAVTALALRLKARDPFTAELNSLLAPIEVRALAKRCRDLATYAVMPRPSGAWPSIPWPAF